MSEQTPVDTTPFEHAAASAPRIDIGISEDDRQEVAEALSQCLADAFTLYLKTHNFHWNVTGHWSLPLSLLPRFPSP